MNFNQLTPIFNPVLPLDNNSTSGSVKIKPPEIAQTKPDDKTAFLKKASQISKGRRKNRSQIKYLVKTAKELREGTGLAIGENSFYAIKAISSLKNCTRSMIVNKEGDNCQFYGLYYCGKKYCATCAKRRQYKLMNKLLSFFQTKAGKEIYNNYDLCLFTVTLKHSDKTRSEPYYKELANHFRNALKYGSFNTFFSGGIYNTEHTYSKKTGHHIHRHAMVLIPKKHKFREQWQEEFKFQKINWMSRNYLKEPDQNEIEKIKDRVKTPITKLLKEQWHSRTGDSFIIDLRPLDNTDLKKSILEITKYMTKHDKGGLIDFEIIKSVEKFNRLKFYGKFGILHKVKELNMNFKPETEVEEKQNPKPENLYLAKGIKIKYKKEVLKSGKVRKIPISVSWQFFRPLLDFSEHILKNFHNDTSAQILRDKLKIQDAIREGLTYNDWKKRQEKFKKP